MKRLILLTLATVSLSVLLAPASAQNNTTQRAVGKISPAIILPLDPAVRTGRLSNGFTYFIRHNTEPKNRVYLYLVNKVGSVLEGEDQRGLAHFLEHMSFNGTKHFPKNELVDSPEVGDPFWRGPECLYQF